jgi:hypothetical protein
LAKIDPAPAPAVVTPYPAPKPIGELSHLPAKKKRRH